MVSHYTNVQLAEMADRIDSAEIAEAIVKDAAESAADKAFRAVLSCHENIRFNLDKIRRARYDMGAKLSVRGRTIIKNLEAAGHRWVDPKPSRTEAHGIENLHGWLADKPSRWNKLRETAQRTSE